MPVKSDRNYRNYRSYQDAKTDAIKADEYVVEGYASTWGKYELYDGISERIEPDAFADCDFADCVFNYNHDGMVFARTRNGSLEVTPDEHGLHIRADLSKTAAARDMWEAIKAGNVDQMSFAFTVDEDEYDKASRTRIIRKIGKAFDVSAVSLPANPETEISARSYCDGVIAAEQTERSEAEALAEKRAKLKLILEV